jgi:YegS/Rv2252/BmrU family lipid kinase
VRRLQLVVNPAAGGGRGRRLTPSVTAALRADGHDVLVTATRSLEHADELVTCAVADDRVVVAMGGDGLVGRVAGTVGRLGGLLAVLPAGRGNDLCRALGVPRRAVPACTVLRTGREQALDLGVVTSATGSVPFLGIASIGFDSEVQERVLRSRVPLGRLVYVGGALLTLARWEPARFRCTVDGAPLPVTGWTVAVADSGCYGGGMRLAPDASLTDGRLDVVTIAALSRTRFLRALPGVFRGTHVRRPEVTVRGARTVELDADRPFRVFADGDPAGTLPATITVLPGAVRVLLP